MIIKHLYNLDDRETVEQIRENMYMQYFLGYSSFTTTQPFDATLFVEFRRRLGMDNLNASNDQIIALKTNLMLQKPIQNLPERIKIKPIITQGVRTEEGNF